MGFTVTVGVEQERDFHWGFNTSQKGEPKIITGWRFSIDVGSDRGNVAYFKMSEINRTNNTLSLVVEDSGGGFADFFELNFYLTANNTEIQLHDSLLGYIKNTSYQTLKGITLTVINNDENEYFDIGDSIDIAMDFSNNGTVNITGTAVIQILDETGRIVQKFNHNISDLPPGHAVQFVDAWNTSDEAEGSYNIIGYVLYDSMATRPSMVGVSTEVRAYLPLVIQSYP